MGNSFPSAVGDVGHVITERRPDFLALLSVSFLLEEEENLGW